METLSAFRIPHISREGLSSTNALFGMARVLQGEVGSQPVRLAVRDVSLGPALPPNGIRLYVSVSSYELQLEIGDLSGFDSVRELCGDSDFHQLHAGLQLALIRAVFQPAIVALRSRVGSAVSVHEVEHSEPVRTESKDVHRLRLEVSSGDSLITMISVTVPPELWELVQDVLTTFPVVDSLDVDRFELDSALMGGFVTVPTPEYESLQPGDLLLLDAYSPSEANLDFVAGGCVIGSVSMTESGPQLTSLRPAPFTAVTAQSAGAGSESEGVVMAGFQFGRLSVSELNRLRPGDQLPLKPFQNDQVSVWANGRLDGSGQLITHNRGVAIRLDRIGRKSA